MSSQTAQEVDDEIERVPMARMFHIEELSQKVVYRLDQSAFTEFEFITQNHRCIFILRQSLVTIYDLCSQNKLKSLVRYTQSLKHSPDSLVGNSVRTGPLLSATLPKNGGFSELLTVLKAAEQVANVVLHSCGPPLRSILGEN